MDVKGNRSTTGTLTLRFKSSAARHVHSLSHILTRSHTHADNHTCNVNLTVEESRPIITEQWWESHNHKDPNRKSESTDDSRSFRAPPNLFTQGRCDLHFGAGKTYCPPHTNVNISLVEPLRSLLAVMCNCAFVFLLSLRSHIKGVFLSLANR